MNNLAGEKNKKTEASFVPVTGQLQANVTFSPGQSAKIESVTIANLGQGDPPLLESKDLSVSVVAIVDGDERPNIAVMLEQAYGVGITSIATHAEGIAPASLGCGRWKITLTFTDLPLHSGEYVVSAYLFDAKGLVVYDEWFQYQSFRYFNPTMTPGLVQLPHIWS